MMKILIGCMIMMYPMMTQAGNTVTHCVATSNELLLALQMAGNSANDDVIRLKVGHYLVPAGGFEYQSTNAGDLSITGGWVGTVNVPCLVNNGFVHSTQLDGMNSERIFEIISDSDPLISLSNLSFINGQAPAGEAGGALFVAELPVFNGGIVLDQTRFADNAGTQGAAIRINQASYIELANSVFDGNITASGGGAVRLTLSDNSLTYVYNNNFMRGEQSISIRDAVTGLSITSVAGAEALIANNVFYQNDIYGFGHSGAGLIHVYHNLLNQQQDPTLDNLNNLIFSDPAFTDNQTNFTPLITSPLINSGLMPGELPLGMVQNWSMGTQDHGHQTRIRDGRIEIGAFEALPESPIFADGFEDN
jgi:hypothetical protein